MTEDDPVIERIRDVRRRIVAECEGDPHKIYEWAKQMEARYADRLVGYEDLNKSIETPAEKA